MANKKKKGEPYFEIREVKTSELRRGDFVVHGNRHSIVKKRGFVIDERKTFLHNHRYVVIEWLDNIVGNLFNDTVTKYYDCENETFKKLVYNEG